MQRWNQRQLLGPKLKKEELGENNEDSKSNKGHRSKRNELLYTVQIRDTIEQDPSTSAESSEWQIVPSPTASERALRHRSSSTPLPSPSTSKPDLEQAAAAAALPPSDDDATELESNAEEARSRASSVTVDEDDEAAVQVRMGSYLACTSCSKFPLPSSRHKTGPRLDGHLVAQKKQPSSQSNHLQWAPRSIVNAHVHLLPLPIPHQT